jgi:hypothetical protein
LIQLDCKVFHPLGFSAFFRNELVATAFALVTLLSTLEAIFNRITLTFQAQHGFTLLTNRGHYII